MGLVSVYVGGGEKEEQELETTEEAKCSSPRQCHATKDRGTVNTKPRNDRTSMIEHEPRHATSHERELIKNCEHLSKRTASNRQIISEAHPDNPNTPR